MNRGGRRLRTLFKPYSDYDRAIAPEIKDDEFYAVIAELAATAPVQTMLEIGSSNGEGSTSAFVAGMHLNPMQPMLFCMELSRPRFEELSRRFASDAQVKCYNVSSVPVETFPTDQQVTYFYMEHDTKLRKVPLPEVLRWLRQDRHYIAQRGQNRHGIREIKAENGIERFGMVLIDGSEFSGSAELEEVYGADLLLLDDTCTFKNFHNFQRLSADPNYRLLATNPELRNGYAVFERLP